MPAYHYILLLTLAQFAQTSTGELRLSVVDASGAPLQSAVELVSEANQFRDARQTDVLGRLVARRVPFGTYRVAVTRDGFASFVGLVEVRSALPTDFHVTLEVASVQAQVTVRAEETLVESHQTTAVHRIGAEMLQQRMTALPGRSLADLVNTQPGWLLESNGILHPRGSEYQTQFVIDGLPFTDNRSPAFAPELGADEVQSMAVLTGGYPAEYGRKLGGVIEVATAGTPRRGWHGMLGASAGGFSTRSADALAEYGWPQATLILSAGMADTDRYLDPPVEENFTNEGAATRGAIRFERDLTAADRLGIIIRHGQVRFLVPNELVQQEAGQRQDRDSAETVAQASYQRVVSGRVLADVRGMVRELSASLWSNPAATPIAAWQQRSIRDLYVKGTVTANLGRQEWKIGADLVAGTVREQFGYQITDARQFDAGTPSAFDFRDRATDREQSVFVQDQLRLGRWTVNAGVRWDHYRLTVSESAVSPRLGVAWSWPAADLVVRASYDRAFQTPAIENLLLASSPAVDRLDDEVVRLPVRPSRGNFFEAGVSKAILGLARLEASIFDRRMADFADDDLLLNTGVSFPIAFRHAEVKGAEIRLDIPRWRAVSGFVSYAHMKGVGDLPVTGGLFPGGEGATLVASTGRFAISQDQRHTVRGRVSVGLAHGGWVALGAAHGSGLPFEFEGDREEVAAQYGARILGRVDFDSGRARPSWSVDLAAGVTVVKTQRRALRLQADVRNVTNRLDLTNFAGLFSGTALAPPRSVAVRLRADF